ncbi:MAG: peroxiredoxin [Ferruginibacter sp.]
MEIQFHWQILKVKKVVVYFYPEDDTPTCTIQACNLRDNFGLLKKEGIVVLGISPDEEKKHKKFEAKYDLPFTLIAIHRTPSLTNTVFGAKNNCTAATTWACTAPLF